MIDFLASQKHYVDHIAPVWNALLVEQRHNFYVPLSIVDYAKTKIRHSSMHLFQYERNFPSESHPMLTCAYGDMLAARKNNPQRKILHMEHGTGHAFGTAAYPNGKGKRDYVSIFLAPNEYTKKLILSVRPNVPCEVIGTPKMDSQFPLQWKTAEHLSPSPVIAIAFHWGDKHSRPPESGSAWEHYKELLPLLNKRYRIIGHGHPLAAHTYKEEFERVGIEWVEHFEDVLMRADIYINDLSSTLYEFLITGKPVIVLNAPWFRRDTHWGIRFWDYSDIGINVEEPEQLFQAIDRTIVEYSTLHLRERMKAVYDLYPYLGYSSQQAASVIADYLRNNDL